MKKLLLTLITITTCTAYAQNVGIGTKAPQNKLHIAGGLRIDTLANTIDSGLVIHNRLGVVSSLKFTGKKSDVLTGDGSFASATLATDAWLLGGNAGTDSNINFLGTIDDRPLKFRVNNNAFGGFGKNIVLGWDGLPVEARGINNVGIGYNVFATNYGGSDNVAIGTHAMGNAAGDNNTAIGKGAMRANKNPEFPGSGNLNTAVGADAMYMLGVGYSNTALGSEALRNIYSSSDNTAVGYRALFSFNGPAFQGPPEEFPDGGNVALGHSSQYSNKSGAYNTALGFEALYSNTSLSWLTATGYRALYSNTTGVNNTATGAWALNKNTTGQFNVANGYQALMNNSSGSDNEAFGYKVLFSNTTGSFNTGTGFRTMYFNTTGNNNTASGFQALNSNTTGSNNTGVGYYADVTAGNFSNATAIGYNAKVNASNKVRIGNASVTKIEGQVPFTTPSDGRYKFNVQEDVKGLSFIMKLRPVTYQFDVNKFDNIISGNASGNVIQVAYKAASQIRRTGFIAQEVEVAANASNYNFSGIDKPTTSEDHYSLSYESFVVPLVKGMQEQQQMIEKLQAIVKHQQEQINELTRKNKSSHQ